MDHYYGPDAFDLTKHSTFDGSKIAASYKETDLRLFGGCPYLLANNCSAFWYDYQKNPKPHGIYIDKKYIRWLKRNHKQHLKSEPFSNSAFLSLLQMFALMTMWVIGPLYLLISIYLWYIDPYKPLLDEIIGSGTFWIIGISYGIARLARWAAAYYDDECGLIFDRPSGKVQYLTLNGGITEEYDFVDFVPKLKSFVNTGGVHEQSSLITNSKACQSVMLGGNGMFNGVLAWNYLRRFMDISQPLPDIPAHETTRHLDPVTKAYDEKIGRDPNYWAKKTEKEVRVMELEEKKLARIWIDERVKLIHEKGVHNIPYLNKLVASSSS